MIFFLISFTSRDLSFHYICNGVIYSHSIIFACIFLMIKILPSDECISVAYSVSVLIWVYLLSKTFYFNKTLAKQDSTKNILDSNKPQCTWSLFSG